MDLVNMIVTLRRMAEAAFTAGEALGLDVDELVIMKEIGELHLEAAAALDLLDGDAFDRIVRPDDMVGPKA